MKNFLVLYLNWAQILKSRQALVKVHIVKYTILWKSSVSVLELLRADMKGQTCRRQYFVNFRCRQAESYSELVAGLIFLWFRYNLYFWNATFDINFSLMTGDAFFLLAYQINGNNRAECLSTKIVCIGYTLSSEILDYNFRKSPFDNCPKSFEFLRPRQTNL